MGKSLRIRFWQRKVHKLLRRDTSVRKTQGLSDARRIGVYYMYRNDAELEQLRGFAAHLAQTGKQVRVLVYFPGKNTLEIKCPYAKCAAFSDRDLDWRFFPRREVNVALEEFLDSEYDLLLDFSAEFHYTDVAVMATCMARMKVGKFTPWNLKVNDLCLAPDADKNYVSGFVKALETYLPLFDGRSAQKQ